MIQSCLCWKIYLARRHTWNKISNHLSKLWSLYQGFWYHSCPNCCRRGRFEAWVITPEVANTYAFKSRNWFLLHVLRYFKSKSIPCPLISQDISRREQTLRLLILLKTSSWDFSVIWLGQALLYMAGFRRLPASNIFLITLKGQIIPATFRSRARTIIAGQNFWPSCIQCRNCFLCAGTSNVLADLSSGDRMFEHAVMTITQQSHLCPLPLDQQASLFLFAQIQYDIQKACQVYMQERG